MTSKLISHPCILDVAGKTFESFTENKTITSPSPKLHFQQNRVDRVCPLWFYNQLERGDAGLAMRTGEITTFFGGYPKQNKYYHSLFHSRHGTTVHGEKKPSSARHGLDFTATQQDVAWKMKTGALRANIEM